VQIVSKASCLSTFFGESRTAALRNDDLSCGTGGAGVAVPPCNEARSAANRDGANKKPSGYRNNWTNGGGSAR
jgi:hypothetical protein